MSLTPDGTGHGQHGSASGLTARHARLAVGAASTLTVFLFETHEATKSSRVLSRRKGSVCDIKRGFASNRSFYMSHISF
jgi:hypothetical protein